MSRSRLEKMNEILNILKTHGGKMKKSKLYGEMSAKYGITKQTFDSYLEALRAQGKIDYKTIHRIFEDIEIKLLQPEKHEEKV